MILNYDITVVCTYHYYDPELRIYETEMETNKNISLEDIDNLEDFSHYLYQTELLKIFKKDIKDVDDFNSINVVTKQIYSLIKDYEPFRECIEQVNNKYGIYFLQNATMDDSETFIFFFSYNYLFLMHKCICEFMNTNQISPINIKQLLNALNE
jgi:hypothetical protein